MENKVSAISMSHIENAFVGNVVRMGEDVILAEHFVPYKKTMTFFKMPAPTLTLLESGKMCGRVNFVPIEATAPCLIVIQPHQTLEIIEQTADTSGRILMFSETFGHLLQLQTQYSLIRSFDKQIVAPLAPDELPRVTNYLDTLSWMLRDIENPFRREGILHMTRSLFFMLGRYFHQTEDENELSNYDRITEQFMLLVQNHCACQRKIEFYATQLSHSTHYLANVVRTTTGKSVSWWITEYTVLEAKRLLAATLLSVHQISQQLCFGDSATFGKFFRRNTGMTPTEFRSRETKKHRN